MPYQNRVARGVPTGGQFTSRSFDEGFSVDSAKTPTGAPLTAQQRFEADFSKANSRTATVRELARLAESDSDVLRLSVAGNGNASEQTIRQLARDADPVVADAARQNPAYVPYTAGEKVRHFLDRVRRGGPVTFTELAA